MLIIFVRAILLYILIIFSMRFMGKRQIGELQPGELVMTIMISNMAALPIEDTNIPMLTGAVPILALVCFEILLSCITLKNKRLRGTISGSPVIVVEDGVVKQEELHKLRFSIDDLMEGLRSKDVFDLQEVHYAIVETNGTLSVLKKFAAQNTTAEMLNLQGEDNAPPLVVISDGRLIKDNLERYGIKEAWVRSTLHKKYLQVSDIFLMTVDKNNNYYIVNKAEYAPANKEEGL